MSGLTPVSFKKGRAHEPRLSAPYVAGKRHERYWTDEEIAVLRERYPTVGAQGCVPFLPRRSIPKIRQQANGLGLKAPVVRAPQQRHVYGPEMDERIRTAWPLLKGRGAVSGLADELGVPRHWLTTRMRHLGLTQPHKKEPNWTAAEVALMRRVPLHNPDRCADIFREHGFVRSATSIMVKAKRLEISRRTHETLSAGGAARILGVDAKHVTALCIAGDLRAGRRGSKRLAQQGGDAWAIEPSELRRYILDHVERVDIRKVEKVAFVALIAGADAIDPDAEPIIATDEALRAANCALTERVAQLQAENARLRALAERAAPTPARKRASWRDCSVRGRRRFA